MPAFLDMDSSSLHKKLYSSLKETLFRLNLTESDSFLNGELLELHMYIVLLIDTLFKNNRLMKSKSKFE